ncbi:MAG: hypothetical protein SGBAC_011726, partial [Bacillariaceae sp.]
MDTTESVKDDIESPEQPEVTEETPEPTATLAPKKDIETFEATLETPKVEEKPTNNEEKKEEESTVEKPTDEPQAEAEQEAKHKDAKMSEGVEVILDVGNGSTIVDQDQNVFRAPNPVRPRAMRAHPHHDVKGSGSYGYGGGPSDGYHHQSPYPYAPSTSFDDAGGYQAPMTASHYSPHVQYPHPTRHGGDVNVISPNHKEHAPATSSSTQRPPMTPRRSSAGPSYQYPPSSPVSSSHHTSPPRMRGYHMRRPEGPYSAA